MSLKVFRHIITAVICVAFAMPVVSGKSKDVSVKVELDSAVLMMGRTTPLHVEILQPQGTLGTLIIPGDTLMTNVEVASVGPEDTVRGKSVDQLEQIKRELLLQSFDSGLYRLPPLAYIVDGGDTVYSNTVTLKVLPADVDSLTTIHSMADVADGSWKWYDWLPDFILDYWLWILICILIVAGGITAWLVLKKKVSLPQVLKSKPVSPYDAAVAGLERLKEEHLCENGREKEYYTRLTDILRRYLDGRFNINAMEMTSTQILRALEKEPEAKERKGMMQRVLEMADFVKFAKMRPMPDDNVASWNRAMQFVEETKPLPEPETEENDSDKETGESVSNSHKEEKL